MAYIKTTISSNGNRADFARALRDFFLNNSLAPFELVSEDYTTEPTQPFFEVERNNLKIKITVSTIISQSQVIASAKTGYEAYTDLKFITCYHSSSDNSDINMYRALQICLIKNEDTLMVHIASYNADKFYKGLISLDTTLTGGENLIAGTSYTNSTSGTAVQLKEVVSQTDYTARPFHIGSPDEATLVLSNQLAVNGNNGVYCGDAIGLQSAGGAKQFGTYVTDTGTYFGIIDDVVILLGDKVEYTSEATV